MIVAGLTSSSPYNKTFSEVKTEIFVDIEAERKECAYRR